VMQYIAGESLQARVQRDGPLGVAEILRIGMQAASGLAAAHAQGLVHRDVKPVNILLENGVDRAYLTDFGLARAADDASLTHTGTVAGTPHYMSPEQADGQAMYHRTDLFSFGAVLYFMATGHPPFRADRPLAVLKRICHDPHRPACQCNPEIPAELSAVIDRLLQKQPARRLASATELQQQLAMLLAAVQQGKLGAHRQRPGLRRRMWLIVAGLIALGALGGAVMGLLVSMPGDPVPRQPAAPSASELRAGGQSSKRQSARDELRSLDPSPPSRSQTELNALLEDLDRLEAIPYPESEPAGQRGRQ
jgi:serine/threonine protein kinase